jgi:hypothetical protein
MAALVFVGVALEQRRVSVGSRVLEEMTLSIFR